MTREIVDERTYRILHNRYHDDGTVEEYYVYFDENVTANAIYLTEQRVKSMADGMRKGSTFNFDYTRYEKQAMYQVDKHSKAFPINGVSGTCDGEFVEIIVHYQDGKENEFHIPVK
jgi:hypothetical protein